MIALTGHWLTILGTLMGEYPLLAAAAPAPATCCGMDLCGVCLPAPGCVGGIGRYPLGPGDVRELRPDGGAPFWWCPLLRRCRRSRLPVA